jgi:hypothetical protein
VQKCPKGKDAGKNAKNIAEKVLHENPCILKSPSAPELHRSLAELEVLLKGEPDWQIEAPSFHDFPEDCWHYELVEAPSPRQGLDRIFVLGKPTSVMVPQNKKASVGSIRMRYKAIDNHWDRIGDKSPCAAFEWVSGNMSAPIGGEQIELLGVKFASEYVGWAGPVSIFLLLLYALAHLRHANARIGTLGVPVYSSLVWVVVMGGWIGSLIGVLSLGAVVAATFLAWHRLIGSSLIASSPVLLGMIALSSWVCIESWRLRRQLLA